MEPKAFFTEFTTAKIWSFTEPENSGYALLPCFKILNQASM
jgi:hypothetical protein